MGRLHRQPMIPCRAPERSCLIDLADTRCIVSSTLLRRILKISVEISVTIPTSTLNRRSFMVSAFVTLSLPNAVAYARHANQAPQISVDPALLEPASEPATLEVERDYSTEIAEPPPPTEYCDLKLFPDVPASTAAFSGVLQHNDLNSAPNMVLVQEFRYGSATEAANDYIHVLGEVQGLAAHKYYLPGPEALTPVHSTENQSLVVHTTENGANFALLTHLENDRVLVLRAGTKESDPTEALQTLLSAILESGMTTPEAGENATTNSDWEVESWRWNYGPIDIHPARYESPICNR